MKNMRPIALVFVLLFVTAFHPLLAANELAGLWEAKKRFGPDARGTLVVRREGTTWTADFVGRVLPLREERGLLTFAIPEGSFRARVEKDGIHGHWTQARTDAMAPTVTPVRLQADGAQRWRGEIAPVEETFTLFLMVGPNGEAFLRNPERNTAIFWNVKRLVRDGNAARLQREDDSTIAEGTYDAEGDVLTLAFPTRGGSYDFKRGADNSAFYPRGRTPARYAYRPPFPRDDGWPVATLEDVGIDRAKIEMFMQKLIDLPIDSIHTPDVHAVLIARHGKLVLEEYFHGEHRDRLHNTRSAAKSVTAVLFGAAGLDPSLPVYQTLGAEADDPRKGAMKAEHLLTMSSGFYCDDNDDNAPGREDTMQQQTAEPDWYRYTLRLPMSGTPGAKAVYCSTNPNLLGAVIAKAGGAPQPELFDRLVARPMQFGRYAFWLQPTGEPYMGGGMQILPRDFLKLGQLIVGEGMWRGKRVLSREFVARASAPQFQIGRRRKYGYLWWIDDRPYRDRTVRAVMALGNGGQIVMAVPELDLVVVFMGGNYSDNALLLSQTNVFVPESILPAVE
jgi:CubicO group peptidase (beta-lactamase class C family)